MPPGQQVHPAVVGRFGGVALLLQPFGPVLRHRVIAVVDEHKARFSGKAVQPVRQTFPVRVAGQAAELPHRGAHRHRLPEQLDFLCPLQQGAAQRARRLISHEQHGTFRPPQVVFQMMADAARVAHAGGGNDDLGRGVGVDGHRIFLCFADVQAGEGQRILAVLHQRQRLLVKAVAEIFPEDGGGFAGQRAVHNHREPVMAVDAALRLDLAEEIQQLLCAAHRKAGNDQIAAPVQRGLQDFRQLGHIVRPGAMAAVAVGGFHHQIVRLAGAGRVLDERLVPVADVPRKDQQFGAAALLGDAQRDGGAAQQMAHIGEPGLDAARLAVKQRQPLAVGLGLELFHHVHRVLHGVVRLHRVPPAALSLAVFPLGLLLLNVGGILQHDAAQVGGGIGGVDGAAVAVFVQVRHPAAVVDVGMGEQQRVQPGGRNGPFHVLVDVLALLHAAVNHQNVSRRLQQRTAAGHFPCGAQKGQFHAWASFYEVRPAPRLGVSGRQREPPSPPASSSSTMRRFQYTSP